MVQSSEGLIQSSISWLQGKKGIAEEPHESQETETGRERGRGRKRERQTERTRIYLQDHLLATHL